MTKKKHIELDGKDAIIQNLVRKLSDIEIKLREIEKKYHDLLNYLPVGVYHTTPDGKLIEVNKSLANLLGFKNETDLKALDVSDLYVEKKDRDRHLKKINKSTTNYREFKLKRKDGQIIWGRDYPRAVLGLDGRVQYYAGILVDVTAQKKAEAQYKDALKKVEMISQERQKMINSLKTLNTMDELSGLYNRRGFIASVQEQLQLTKGKNIRLYFAFIDIDNLKKINDLWGHKKGDEAIISLAKILKASMRKSDIKGRLGGDEFAVLVQKAPKSGVNTLISRLHKNLKEFNSKKMFCFELSVSIGIAEYDSKNPCSMDELMIQADKLMYRDKKRRGIE
jgi:diguanylate cyclase (GGDEF)-like protein/PAS domain S-box-containing protein